MSKRLMFVGEPCLGNVIHKHFTNQGYQVELVCSGELVLDAVLAGLPDLVLVDVELPEMRGDTLCQTLREDDRLLDMPIILLARDGSRENHIAAYAAGANDFVTKPFDLEELASRIHVQLQQHSESSWSQLTALPGGVALRQALLYSLNNPTAGQVLVYVNIEHLAAYNETYSYLEGDELIGRTAQILREALAVTADGNKFLGYVGNGEFILITTASRRAIFQHLATARFNQVIPPNFYPVAARESGYFQICEHDGTTHPCPLVALRFETVLVDEESDNTWVSRVALPPALFVTLLARCCGERD